MIFATFIFALQDGLSRHLVSTYNVYMIVMIRYWFLSIFVIALALRSKNGIIARARTSFLLIQIIRETFKEFDWELGFAVEEKNIKSEVLYWHYL